MLIIDRDFEWKSGGRYTKIKDMGDIYLMNVIHYVKTCRAKNKFNNSLLKFLTKEAKTTRKLKQEFIDMAPFPYKDSGYWKICDKNRWDISYLSGFCNDSLLDYDFKDENSSKDIISKVDVEISESNEIINRLKSYL